MSASGVREGLTEEVSLELTWKEGQGDWQVGGGRGTHLQREGSGLGDA